MRKLIIKNIMSNCTIKIFNKFSFFDIDTTVLSNEMWSIWKYNKQTIKYR